MTDGNPMITETETKFIGPASSIRHHGVPTPLADCLLDILVDVVNGVEPPKNEPADHAEYREAITVQVAEIHAAGTQVTW